MSRGPPMAESRRKADAKKSAKAEPSQAEEAQRNRLERMTLLLYLEAAVAIVIGMIVLSQFLSRGAPSRPILYTAAALFGVLAIGVGFTWFARRKARGPAA